MTDQSRLAISARLEEVRNACDFVVEAAERAGLDERAVYHCQMAVDEIRHAIRDHMLNALRPAHGRGELRAKLLADLRHGCQRARASP